MLICPVSNLDSEEINTIALYKSQHREHGYNIKDGGSRPRVSAETRLKISQSKKGKPASKKAKQAWLESRKNMSAESLQKMKDGYLRAAELNRVKHRSEEIRLKISQTKTGTSYNCGENHPNYGKHLSEETRVKIARSHKGKKMSEKCMGRKMTKETRKKLSDAFTGRECTWKNKIGLANKGKKRTEAMNIAQSKRAKEAYAKGLIFKYWRGRKKEKVLCKYCGEYCDTANLKKWHNENSNCVLRLKERKEEPHPGKRGRGKHNKNPFYSQKEYRCPYCNVVLYTKCWFDKAHGENCKKKPIPLQP